MMSFCKRSVHSFLGTTTTNNNNDYGTVVLKPPSRCRNLSSPIDGLSLIAVTGIINSQKSSNVLESAIIKSSTTPASSPCTAGESGSSFSGFGATAERKDPGGIGFIDDIGGGVDGLMSCTESLGFESSDERRTDDQLDQQLQLNYEGRETELCSTARNRWRKSIKVRSEPKSFPPPLSSLKQNGQPSFYLRPVRKDGRLELTEVRIDRAEVLHASRRDGRLRLHLIRDEIEEDDDDDDVEEEEEEIVENSEEEEKEKESEWKLPAVATTGGGDGFRRCYELMNHHQIHHHNNLHVWSQQHCVTTG